jgi:hypothetical protein
MRREQKTAVALFAFVICTFAFGQIEGVAVEQIARPDIVTIVAADSIEELERPPVQFPHDLHTEALAKQNKDCTTCHLTRDNGRLSDLFERLGKPGERVAKDVYHDNCIGCHNETASADLKTGPVSCGECHRKDPLYTSSLRPFGFDKSLHYRHIKAYDNKCDPCHHIYDEKTQKLVYVKGREDPCRDCHGEKTVGNRSSFKIAAHEACVGCHREISTKRPKAPVGPQSCGGCHDRQKQMAIKVIENPPRLQRGQPDSLFLSAPEADLANSKLNTVPFMHVDHERATTTCRACHHKKLEKCQHCHTLSGSDRSEGVTLQQAMHLMTSNHSCVGCHQLQKSKPQCAGCHDRMEKGRLSDHACPICHSGPSPGDLARAQAQHASMDAFAPKTVTSNLGIPVSEIPDTVTIRALSTRYPPVKMPHRKIVTKLSDYVKNNKIAAHFHGGEAAVCQGCHHHGAVGRNPALCENCHGEPFRKSELFVPGLKGAYHRQCLGCHLSMGLQAVSNCTVCHGDIDLIDETTSRPSGEGTD